MTRASLSIGLRERLRKTVAGCAHCPVAALETRGGGSSVVASRSALVRGQDAWRYGGCGRVDGSDPDREYAESRLKLEPMLWAMNGGDG